MKIKLEYIWLDGYKPEPNLRSKVKVVDAPTHEVKGKTLHGITLKDCPQCMKRKYWCTCWKVLKGRYYA